MFGWVARGGPPDPPGAKGPSGPRTEQAASSRARPSVEWRFPIGKRLRLSGAAAGRQSARGFPPSWRPCYGGGLMSRKGFLLIVAAVVVLLAVAWQAWDGRRFPRIERVMLLGFDGAAPNLIAPLLAE